MIVVATSAAWDCPYCVIAHGAILRLRTKDPLLADFLATNYRAAERRRRASGRCSTTRSSCPCARRRSRTPTARACTTHGFSDDDIWDISVRRLAVRAVEPLAHAGDIRPNPEFHTLGR